MSKGNRNHALYVCQLAANSLVGYLFARMLAYQFGTSAEKDGFDIAYSVPFIVLNLSGLAYIHSVVTTQYARMLARKSPEINAVFSVVLTWMTSAAIVLLIVATFFSEPLTELLAPGLSPAVRVDTENLLLLMLPLALTLGIGTFFGAILAAHEVPVIGEFCQIISRVAVIGLALLSGFQFSLVSTAVGLVVASGVGLAIQWWILHTKTSVRFHPRFFSNQPELLTILKQGSGFLACAIVAQVAMAYMRRLAVLDGVGTIAALSYALAVVTPLSLFIGKPLALRIGPRYAELAANERWTDARRILVKSAGACLVVSLPVCVLASSFASPLVRLLFGGGQFNAQSIDVTASLSAYVVWALPASLLLWVIVMPTLSTRNSSLPGAVLTAGHVTHIALSAALFGPFGKFGIAAAYVAAINLQALYGTGFLVYEWRRASQKTRAAPDPLERPSAARAMLARRLTLTPDPTRS